jgi:hypothetical protein
MGFEDKFLSRLIADIDTSSYGAETGRKDSLSLNVEFVKVNISRSRKGWSADNVPNTSVSSGKLGAGIDAKSTNCVRFSGKAEGSRRPVEVRV